MKRRLPTATVMSYAGITVNRALWLAAVVLLSRKADAQQMPVLTVCEALHGLTEYTGKFVIVVGRAFYTFEGFFLNEDCGHDGKTTVQGQKWLSMIAIGSSESNNATAAQWDL